jgi:hypothetical protein
MEDKQKEHPASSLAQRFLIDQIGVSNQFANELLLRVQNSLIVAIPNEKEKIEHVLQRFQHTFNSCSSLVNRNSK